MDNILLKSPLESAYSELGLTGLEDKTYRNYPIYMPKQSNEYFSLKHGTKPYIDNPLDYQVYFYMAFLKFISSIFALKIYLIA